MEGQDFWHILYEGLIYDFTKYVVGPFIVTCAGTLILKKVFHKLEERKETLYFCVCSFIAICTLFYFIGVTKQGPLLVGNITSEIAGQMPGRHDSVAVLTIGIVNSGNTQTAVTGWRATVNINGVVTNGIVVNQPKDVSFDTSGHGADEPLEVTYRAEDNILEKSINPLPTGGLLSGQLFVVFNGLDVDSMKTGAIFTAYYHDVFSHEYSMNIRTGGKFVIGSPEPGLHTQMQCPATADQLKSLVPNQSPTTLPSQAPNKG